MRRDQKRIADLKKELLTRWGLNLDSKTENKSAGTDVVETYQCEIVMLTTLEMKGIQYEEPTEEVIAHFATSDLNHHPISSVIQGLLAKTSAIARLQKENGSAQRELICRAFLNKKQVWVCRINEKGGLEGDDGGGWAAAQDELPQKDDEPSKVKAFTTIHALFQFTTEISEVRPRKQKDFKWRHQGPEDNPFWILYSQGPGKMYLGTLLNDSFFNKTIPPSDLLFSIAIDSAAAMSSMVELVVQETLASYDNGKIMYPKALVSRLMTHDQGEQTIHYFSTIECMNNQDHYWMHPAENKLLLDGIDTGYLTIPALPFDPKVSANWEQTEIGWLFIQSVLFCATKYGGKKL